VASRCRASRASCVASACCCSGVAMHFFWPRAAAAKPSVAVELDEAFVADPEVVRDLVEYDATDLPHEQLVVAAVEPLQRPAVDRDPVRRDGGVAARAPCQRHALVEPEQGKPGRRLV